MLCKPGTGVMVLCFAAGLSMVACGDDDGGAVCGDGVVEGSEVCDGTALNGRTCADEGFAGGELRCAAACGAFDTDLCTDTECGNNQVEGAEECDGADLDDTDCADRGFAGGVLSCTGSCTFDESGCSMSCGDGEIQAGDEVCDGANVGTADCLSESFDGGTLACSDDCQRFDTSGCCDDGCSTEGEATCSGDTLRVCTVGANGCLDLVDTDCTANGQVCDDSQSSAVCADPCTSDCTVVDDTYCQGNVLRTCTQVGACLNWVDTDCGSSFCWGTPAACQIAAPTGEDCGQAIVLSDGVNSVASYSAGSLDVLTSALVDCHGGYAGDADAVWMFTLDATSNAVTIDISKTAGNALVAVLLDDCLTPTAGASTACSTDMASTTLSLNAAGLTPGASYYLVVGNADLGSGFPDSGLTQVELTQANVSCGDGVIDSAYGETCDDGNGVGGDGCAGNCRIEPTYDCAGEPSTCWVIGCGDGFINTAGEVCDDGNLTDGDGCDALCQPELGWICANEPSVCIFMCGNGSIDTPAAEQCDDNNATAGDGCDANCQLESGNLCTGAPSSCVLTCGDGVMGAVEECDDGNLTAGDGCSPGCQLDASSIAPSGTSFSYYGSLDASDPLWARPEQDCTATATADRHYDVYAVANTFATDMAVTISASWSGDGYLHLFRRVFNAATQSTCLLGNDDDTTLLNSRISSYTIPAGEVLVIVASAFHGNDPTGAYSLSISTD